MQGDHRSDHEHEEQRLAATIKAIDVMVQELRGLGWSGGAVPHAGFQARKWGWEKADRLLQNRPSPYFGRIDRVNEEQDLESFYIGPEGLQSPTRTAPLIIDWRAPIAAAFYQTDEQTFLKRQFDIKEARLIKFIDEVVQSLTDSGRTTDSRADPVLLDILSGARGGNLGSIVRTIQAQQDRLIRASDPVLVVQGAAGTGKTVVALHRIAYLLYRARAEELSKLRDPQNDLPAQQQRSASRPVKQLKIAVFGPNKSYLRHIRPVLPSLGEHGTVETTFDAWIMAAGIADSLDALVRDDDLEEMLDTSIPREQRARAFRRSRVKGSLGMGDLLFRYVSLMVSRQLAMLETQPLRFFADIAARPVAFQATPQFSGLHTRMQGGMPLNGIRDLVRDRMRQAVLQQVDRHLSDRGAISSRQGNVRQYNHVLERFTAEFDRRWPRTSASSLYAQLLADETSLREAATGTQIELKGLLDSGAGLRMEDLAPLAYLTLLVDGAIPIRAPGGSDTEWTRLDHVVIDEAQDLAPLALKVIHAHADNLTVLGDMNQTVYAHRGSRSWREVLDAMGQDAQRLHTLSVSYRSTQPISDLANHVVRVGGLEGGVSRPFTRVGPLPILQGVPDQPACVASISRFVTQSMQSGAETVAILTRTAARAKTLQGELEAHISAPSVCVTDRHDDRDAPIVVMPAYLAKGIEFDAVVVADVDASAYANCGGDAAILYVAITRALNHLMLIWAGTPSPLIADRV